MTLNAKQQKILEDVKVKQKTMVQVSRLQKEISSMRKKLEMKESKLSELINILDDKNCQDEKSLVSQKVEKGKSEDSSDLFTEG